MKVALCYEGKVHSRKSSIMGLKPLRDGHLLEMSVVHKAHLLCSVDAGPYRTPVEAGGLNVR